MLSWEGSWVTWVAPEPAGLALPPPPAPSPLRVLTPVATESRGHSRDSASPPETRALHRSHGRGSRTITLCRPRGVPGRLRPQLLTQPHQGPHSAPGSETSHVSLWLVPGELCAGCGESKIETVPSGEPQSPGQGRGNHNQPPAPFPPPSSPAASPPFDTTAPSVRQDPAHTEGPRAPGSPAATVSSAPEGSSLLCPGGRGSHQGHHGAENKSCD